MLKNTCDYIATHQLNVTAWSPWKGCVSVQFQIKPGEHRIAHIYRNSQIEAAVRFVTTGE